MIKNIGALDRSLRMVSLVEHRIHRAPVVDGGRLVGIVSAFDLVALIARDGEPA